METGRETHGKNRNSIQTSSNIIGILETKTPMEALSDLTCSILDNATTHARCMMKCWPQIQKLGHPILAAD